MPQVSSYRTQVQAEEPLGAANGTNSATARASVLNLPEIRTEKVPFEKHHGIARQRAFGIVTSGHFTYFPGAGEELGSYIPEQRDGKAGVISAGGSFVGLTAARQVDHCHQNAPHIRGLSRNHQL